MEQLSMTAFWLSFGLASLSAALYAAHVAGARIAVRRLVTDTGLTMPMLSVEKMPHQAGKLASATLSAAAASSLLAVAFRGFAVGHAPWSNMWEYSLALSGSMMLFYLIFERWHRQRTIGAVVLPVIVAIMGISALEFPSTIQPLVPALQSSDILALHVGVLILAYGAFSISFGAAVMYLLHGGKSAFFARLPKRSVLDDVAFRSVTVGFPLLSAGIALGAYWANHAWGRYWGWDPKETSILVSWLIYGVYLHAHALKNWKGRRSAVILVAGYASIMFSYYGVNLFIAGLHSYAGT